VPAPRGHIDIVLVVCNPDLRALGGFLSILWRNLDEPAKRHRGRVDLFIELPVKMQGLIQLDGTNGGASPRVSRYCLRRYRCGRSDNEDRLLLSKNRKNKTGEK